MSDPVSDLIPVRRALLSVSDKTGLAEFAGALHREFGIELISTGGTAKFLRDHQLPVTDVSDVTGFPEMMDGRLKTLHPMIHGGLLALRDEPTHSASMEEHQIRPIDLVCVNLYPFEQTVARPNVTFDEAVENIDIGGPSMVRSAAKNHRYVLVVTSPERYDKVLGDLREHGGSSCGKHRLKLAQRAFALTSRYDGAIARYLADEIEPVSGGTEMPPTINIQLSRKQPLRYGENPHQKAALYVEQKPAEPSVAFTEQLHGKELSYINLLDADAALAAVGDLPGPGACIVKHATPCGFATADDLPTAFRNAFAGDPLAAFGGIVAFNRTVDLPTARAITSVDKLLEVIVAPAFDPDALDLLRKRWKNVRLLAVGRSSDGGGSDRLHLHKIVGGYLVQERDTIVENPSDWTVVSQRQPSGKEMSDLALAWTACKHVKSNAIVIAAGGMMFGSGAGQQDRVNACRIAVQKAGDRVLGAVAASDAFFPFPDGPDLLLSAGITALIHPGGSVNDALSIQAADAAGAAMLITGKRHFKH